jgi:lysozyme
MSGRLRTSRQGLDLIKSFEGFRPASARLADGRWTIGYGHVRSAREGVVISEQDAEDLLKFDLRGIEEAVNDLAFTPLNQNQFDALSSLVFNISPGQFKDSDVLSRLNAGDYFGAAASFEAWRKARINGRLIVVDALVRRRAIEKALFLEPEAGRPAAPTPIVTPELDKTTYVYSREAVAVDAPLNGSRADATAKSAAQAPAVEDDIASAIAGLAERQNAAEVQARVDAATPSPVAVETVEESFVEVTEVTIERFAEFTEQQPVEAAPQTPDEAARIVAARLAKILARAEVQVDQMEAADRESAVAAALQPEAPPASVQPAAASALPQQVVEQQSPHPRPRIFIDDTEIYDPGRDPAELFAEIEAKQAQPLREAQRPLHLKIDLAALGPWLAVLALSIMGLAVGLVEIVENTESPGAAFPGALTVAAVFGLMLVMSLYFIVARVFDPER